MKLVDLDKVVEAIKAQPNYNDDLLLDGFENYIEQQEFIMQCAKDEIIERVRKIDEEAEFNDEVSRKDIEQDSQIEDLINRIERLESIHVFELGEWI